jgi:hypothetical protein
MFPGAAPTGIDAIALTRGDDATSPALLCAVGRMHLQHARTDHAGGIERSLLILHLHKALEIAGEQHQVISGLVKPALALLRRPGLDARFTRMPRDNYGHKYQGGSYEPNRCSSHHDLPPLRRPVICHVLRLNVVLFCHRLLDQTDDDHEDGAAHAATGHLADEAADIEAARWGAGSHRRGTTDDTEGTQQLTSETATYDSRDRVADGSEALFFEHTASDVATNSTTDQANDQTEDPVPVPLLQVELKSPSP